MKKSETSDAGDLRASYRYQSQIKGRLDELSAAEQTVAAHLIAHPEELPFETAESIARRLRVSAMTVGRTLKALGYNGLADIRAQMRADMADATPWARRGASVAAAPALKSHDRARALQAEQQAIQAVHEMAETPLWKEVVELLASAERVFVAGFQTERGLALSFADQLAYIRGGVRFLTIEDRGFADLRTEMNASSCLVIVDCRRYSRWFRLLGETAVSIGAPLVMASDMYCTWARKLTPLALLVRTDSGRFWDNNSPLLSMLNLLIEDVIEQLGDAIYTQLDAATEFGSRFMGFDRTRVQAEEGDSRQKRGAFGPGPRGSKATRSRS